MSKPKIYFWADASATIGYGHFVRTLALADMLKDDFKCTFFTTFPSTYQIWEMEKVCTFVSLKEETKYEYFLNQLSGDEIVVLDNYFFSTEYQLQIKNKGCKLVCVDDIHNRHFVSDAVVNPVLSPTSKYDTEPYTKQFLGLEYALLRKPFITTKHTFNKEMGRWLLSFGGTDFDNLTEKFLCILNDDSRVKSVTVIVGDAYRYIDNLKKYDKAIVLKNLSAEQMSKEMLLSEYAVLPSSTVSIEALASGCKVANGYFVDNQIEAAQMYKQYGYCIGIGNLKEVSGVSFIDQLIQFEPSKQLDFSLIPSRYIEIFKTL